MSIRDIQKRYESRIRTRRETAKKARDTLNENIKLSKMGVMEIKETNKGTPHD